MKKKRKKEKKTHKYIFNSIPFYLEKKFRIFCKKRKEKSNKNATF